MQRILLVGGARPNFMKLAPLVRAFDVAGIAYELVHTGQHYDAQLSEIFFEELGLPSPSHALRIDPGDHRVQIREIVQGLVPVLKKQAWDGVLVVGDVTSTVGATIAAVLQDIPVIHVEAGLRSFNWKMPEEINRVFVDRHASYLFATEPMAVEYLRSECVAPERIFEVGNVMVDTMHLMRPKIDASNILAHLHLEPRKYGVATLHRAELFQEERTFSEVWSALEEGARSLPLIAPLHPRTKAELEKRGIVNDSIRIIDALGYVDMQRLIKDSAGVWTDSGGLQEETTVYGVPCFTVREETERPITVSEGTNTLVGCTRQGIEASFIRARQTPKTSRVPRLWDGHAAERIADVLLKV